MRKLFLLVLAAAVTSCTAQRWQATPNASTKTINGRIMDVYQTEHKGKKFNWAKVGYLHVYVPSEQMDSTIQKGKFKNFNVKRLGAK